MADHGIVRLDLNAQASTSMDHGTRLGLLSTYQTVDGQTHDLVDVFFDSLQGVTGLVAAAVQLKPASSQGAELVQALSEAGFVAQRVQAGTYLSADDDVAALLLQAGLLSAEGGALVDILSTAADAQLHLSLKDLADLGVDAVHLNGHATVDLGINSLSRQELTDLLSALQGQRADADQPLFSSEGATLVMDNAVLTDLLQGESQGDPVVHSILQSLKDLGVTQLDGVDTAPMGISQTVQATQSAVLVESYAGVGVETLLLGQPDAQDLSYLLDHDMLAKPLN